MNPNEEARERRECPAHVTKELRLAGGENPYGEPIFRVVWGNNRIVPITGEWQEFVLERIKITDRFTGESQTREGYRLKSSVIETREVPKYQPGNCWFLECWRPPEEYGTPGTWAKLGEEVVGCSTVDTAGPFPSRGEYELCYPLTSNGSFNGIPILLVSDVVADLVRMILAGKERFTSQQRRCALEQEAVRKEEGFVRVSQDILREAGKAFYGEEFVTVLSEVTPKGGEIV